MDDLQLKDEAVASRVRAAAEFLDPRMCSYVIAFPTNRRQKMYRHTTIERRSF